jgi:hypothetical protein
MDLMEKLKKEYGHRTETEEVTSFMTPDEDGEWMKISRCIDLINVVKKEEKIKIANRLQKLLNVHVINKKSIFYEEIYAKLISFIKELKAECNDETST